MAGAFYLILRSSPHTLFKLCARCKLYVNCHASNAFLSIFHLSIRSVTHFILLNMTFQGNSFRMLFDLTFNNSINLLVLHVHLFTSHILRRSRKKGDRNEACFASEFFLNSVNLPLLISNKPVLFSVCILMHENVRRKRS